MAMQRLRTLTRSARGVAPEARRAAAAALVRGYVAGALRQSQRRAARAPVKAVEMVLGMAAANRYFWRSWGRLPVWFDVQQRLERIYRTHPEALDGFVFVSLEHAADPLVVIGLARHPLSTAAAGEWFTTTTLRG